MMMYVAIFLTFLFVWVFTCAVFFTLFHREKPVDKLKYFDEDYIPGDKHEKRRKQNLSMLKLLSGFIPSPRHGSKHAKSIEMELMKADIPVTPEELLVIKVLSSAAFAFLAYAASKEVIIAVIIFVLIWNLPKVIIARRKKEIVKLFDSQLNEGIMIISNSLKAGYSFLQAIAVTSEETKDPFSKEFKKMLKEMSLGISEEDSMRNLLQRMESEDLRLIVNAILIQKDIGGNLSEILDNISDTIRDRQRIKEELKTLTAQGKLSGLIVILIPIFLGVVIYLFNREYIMLLFTTPIGLAMIGLSVLNQILGVVLIRKIINIDM